MEYFFKDILSSQSNTCFLTVKLLSISRFYFFFTFCSPNNANVASKLVCPKVN